MLTAPTVDRLTLKNWTMVGADVAAFEVLGESLRLRLIGANTVTTADVRQLMYAPLSDAQQAVADADGNGAINTSDARLFLTVCADKNIP